MATLASLVVKFVGDVSGFIKDTERASKSFEKTAKKITSAGETLTAGVTLPLVGIGVIAVNAASDLDESMNKVNVVFGDSAGAIQDFASGAADNLGITEQKALEAAGTFGNLFVAMEMGEGPAAEMSTGLVQLAADLGSFNNMDPTEVLDKLRAGVVGETEPLRTLGVNLTAVAVENKALEMGLAATTAELTQADKVTARYALIMEQTKTAQGDFARTSDGLANSTRILKSRVGDAAAELGTKLLPVALDLVTGLSDLVSWFTSLDDTTQTNIVKAGAFAAALGPVLLVTGKVVGGIGSLISVAGQVGPAINAMSGALAAANLSGGALVLTMGAIAVAVGAAFLAYQKYRDVQDQVKEGMDQVNDEWGEFFGKLQGEGASALEIVDAYQSKQSELNDILEAAPPLVRLFIDEEEILKGNTEALATAIYETSGSYEEYKGAMDQAELSTQALTDAEYMVEKGILTADEALLQYNPELGLARRYTDDLEAASGDLDTALEDLQEPTGLLAGAITELSGSYNAADTANRLLNEGIGLVSDSMVEQERLKLVLKLATEDLTAAEIEELLNQQDTLENMQALNDALDAGTISKYDWIAAVSDGIVTQEEINALLGIEADTLDRIVTGADSIPNYIPVEIDVSVTGDPIPNMPGQGESPPIPMQHGGDYWVTRPTLFLAGEAGPERVIGIPAGKSGPGGTGDYMYFDFRGAMVDEQKIKQQVHEALAQKGMRADVLRRQR